MIVGYRNGGWSLPGGAREPGETLVETVVRETKEEAGGVVAVERTTLSSLAFEEQVPGTFFLVPTLPRGNEDRVIQGFWTKGR